MIGQARVTRRGAGRAVLAIAVAAAAAIAVYFATRALGGDAPATGQGEPLALAINVGAVCEGGQAYPHDRGIWGYDDDGNWVQTGTTGPYYLLSDLGVKGLRWQIEGGTAPYEISVQGRTLPADPTGFTIVYCADSLPVDELDFTAERSELEQQETDSPATVSPGPLNIEATVKDANGLTARARAATNVILDCHERYCDFDVYPSGFTYRIKGMLFTIPQGLRLDVRWIGYLHPHCAEGAGPACQDRLVLRVVDDPYDAVLDIGMRTREYLGYKSTLSPEFQWAIPDYAMAAGLAADGADATPHPNADKFNQFGESLGQRPQRPNLDGN